MYLISAAAETPRFINLNIEKQVLQDNNINSINPLVILYKGLFCDILIKSKRGILKKKGMLLCLKQKH